MKKKLVAVVMALFLIANIGGSAFAVTDVSDQDQVVWQKDYQVIQLNDEAIVELALKGILINNEHTQVKLTEDSYGNKVVQVHKKLDEKKLLNGTTISDYTVFATGNISTTDYFGSYTGSLKVGFNYSTKDDPFSTQTGYKVTSYFSTASISDTSFRLTELGQTVTQFGVGFTESGGAYANDEYSRNVKTYPVSGTSYQYNTGFNTYVIPQYGSHLRNDAYVRYERNTTGQMHIFYLSIDLFNV